MANKEIRKIRIQNLKNGQKKEINEILYYQGLYYILETISIKLISRLYNDLLADQFEINKI